MGTAPPATPPPVRARLIAQQLRDLSDAAREIPALASIQHFVGASPSCLLLHDARGSTAAAFLVRAAAALGGVHPGVRLFEGRLPTSEMRLRPLEIDLLGRPRPGAELAGAGLADALGLPCSDLRALIAAAGGAYDDYLPSFPDPAELGPAAAGLDVQPASLAGERVSGYLVRRGEAEVALVIHDADPGDPHRVNSYLSRLRSGWHGPPSIAIERSVRDRGEGFCLVKETATGLRSTATLELPAAAGVMGVAPWELRRLAERAARLRRWQSPFAACRPLPRW